METTSLPSSSGFDSATAEVADASKVSDAHEVVAQETSLPTRQSDAISGFDSMVRYFHTMEERIKSLELQVAQLSGSAAKLDLKTGGTSGSEYRGTSTSTLPDIVALDQGDFEGPDPNGYPVRAIEMLIGDDGAASKLRIRSEQLLRILQDVMGTEIIPDISQSLVMARPFKALMTFRSSLLERRPTIDLDVLNVVLTTKLKPDTEAYSSLRNREDLIVSFPHLWYLFQPGDIVADSLDQSAQAYRVLSVAEIVAKNSQETTGASDAKNSFCITCCYFGYNGKIFGPVRKVFRIPHFHGKISVTSLPITPIKYQRDYNMRKLLIERGKRFTSLNTPRHQMHAGMTIDEIPIKLDGEVIIDFELFYREHPDKVPRIDDLGHMLNGYDEEHSLMNHDAKVDKYLVEKFLEENATFFKTTSPDRNGVSRDLEDKCLVLMPNLVWANHLKSRKWHALDINRTYDVLYPTSPFEYLVIPAKHKKMLLSLASHSLAQTVRPDSDLTIEKGSGLVMLFHGAPGVGKTSTAECLAASVKKPLFPITAADLGTTPEGVEMGLEVAFERSQRWGCIALLDEADIILQRRDRLDFSRNAIVSVFLRILDYYSGILIMTTTRVGTLDEAFISRIHISLYFPMIDKHQFLKIWEIAFHRVEREKNISISNMAGMMRFLKDVWDKQDRRLDGRKIMNAVQSAVALAEYDSKLEGGKIEITPQHVEAVLDMAEDFSKYMAAVHGTSETTLAKRMGDRNDEWDKPKPSYRAASRPLFTTSRESAKPALNRSGAFDSDSDQ